MKEGLAASMRSNKVKIIYIIICEYVFLLFLDYWHVMYHLSLKRF